MCILRDRADGRLYIVDANKTDMGPPIALPIPPKLMAVRMIAERKDPGLTPQESLVVLPSPWVPGLRF